MSMIIRKRSYQDGSLEESRYVNRWFVKYYYAPGKQTTKTLGRKKDITRKQAEEMREAMVKPLNHNSLRNLGEESFEHFIENVFFPMKKDTDWRENTGKESMREIQKHVIGELGHLQCQEITAALLRALLKKKAEQGLGKETVNHIRFYMTDICRTATAEGYLTYNVSEGLKSPKKLLKPSEPKQVASLEEYAQAWPLLDERERLCFDLVMFAGMRESEAIALWCGDITDQGIKIDRGFYKGLYGPPKTEKSDRMVGVPDDIMERLRSWISGLPTNEAKDCVFPSETLVTPVWPENMLSRNIRPRLRPVGLGWINFEILRRSHSTLHKERDSDLKVIADQQGHGMRTHLEGIRQDEGL
jgi:integrase